MQYLFQLWSCPGPMKYRDMLLDIGTEEIAHVDMLATMIARLLEGTPVAVQEEAVRDPAVMAVMGGRNPQHNQWIAAIAELEADGLDATPVPNTFPQSLELRDVSYQFWSCSSGVESREGKWARGATSDGRGTFEYVEDPRPLGPEPDLGTVDPRTWGTPPSPVKVSARKAG